MRRVIMRPDGPAGWSATEAISARASKRLSAVDWVDQTFARIDARDPEVRAWVHLMREGAVEEAKRHDRVGALAGPLAGLPIGVKDVIDVAGVPTACNSPIEAGRVPARHATAVERLVAAGAIVIGKTVTTEYAFTEPGPTRHPEDPRRTPGGSSSGSAAAVADFHVPAALATQTGGSTIRPAAYCGIVGYKPPFGCVPNDGLHMLAPSIDCIGIHARTVSDAALLASVLEGRDRTVDARDTPAFVVMRLSWENEFSPDAIAMVEGAADRLRRAGAAVREMAAPDAIARANVAHRVIMAVEVARTFEEIYGHDKDRLSASLRGFIERGQRESALAFGEAHAAVARARATLAPLMSAREIILTAAATGEAPEGLASTGNAAANRIWTLLQLGAVTVPAGRGSNGLPLGLQLIDPMPSGDRLFPAAAFAERALEPHRNDIFRSAA
jgi:Asp-tRNA(Asn)/Glu-tRNA(Gln) amidotransferase A subunit family amidase